MVIKKKVKVSLDNYFFILLSCAFQIVYDKHVAFLIRKEEKKSQKTFFENQHKHSTESSEAVPGNDLWWGMGEQGWDVGKRKKVQFFKKEKI